MTKITIKPADKGGKIVIQDTTDYITECERQLENTMYYKRLYTDPTAELNSILRTNWNKESRMDISPQKNLRYFPTETQELPISTHYPRYIKPIIQDDP